MTQWTDDQRQVIDTRNQSQMVSAAAGSGKTAVMTEHVLQLLEEDMDITSMAIVTFTQAAAGEMRQRIRQKLEEALPRRPKLREQLDQLEDAWIGTFHGLCTRLITRYGAVAQLPPGLVAAGAEEQAILWQDAVEQALEQAFAQPDEGLRILVKGWGRKDGVDARSLSGLIKQLYDYVMARPQGLTLAREMKKIYEAQVEDPDHPLWREQVEREARGKLEQARLLLGEGLRLCDLPQGPAHYRPTLEKDLAALAQGGAMGKLPGKRNAPGDPALAEQVKNLRKQVKELQQKAAELSEAPDEDMDRMIPAVGKLVELTEAAASFYSTLKEERGLMDFNDMEHFALRILEDDAVAGEMQDTFKMVLIDEYQDTNQVQEAIATRISRPDNLFTVGDMKQSIYGFRQADPELFLRRCSLPDNGQRRLTRLSHNFRSAPGVVDFVNAVFFRLMNRERGGVAYDDNEKLVCRARRPDEEDREPAVEWVLVTPDEAQQEQDQDQEGDDRLEELSAVERQTLAAISVIRRRMGKPIYDGKLGGFRPACWRDFVILTRTRSKMTGPITQTLQRHGIPAYALGGGGWMDQLEVQQTLALLALIDNQNRDLELLLVMRSSLGNFSLEELYEIRRLQPRGSYAQAAAAAAQGSGQLAQRLREFLSRLEDWRQQARILPVDELIWRVLDESGYYDSLGLLPDGELRQGNLRILMERARGLAGTPNRGIYGLLGYIERMKQQDQDCDMAATLPENADVVRVTTIHMSKGLEYPVVILLNLNKKLNEVGRRGDRFQMHEKLGFGMQAVLLDRRLKHPTLSQYALSAMSRRMDLSEEVRVLYVALTRAREGLVLIGQTPNLNKDLQQWSRPVPVALEMAEGCYYHWLGPVLLRCPGAEQLRLQAGMEPKAEIPCPVRVTINPPPEEELPRADELSLAARPDAALLAGFAWRYPHLTNIPAKMAATDRILPAQAAMTRAGENGRFTAAQRGTFTHQVLEKLTKDPRDTARRLAEQGLFPREALEEIHYPWLEQWLEHPLHRRVLASSRVYRELPFNLAMTAREALGRGGEETVMVQGVIDLAFMEGDGWVLVDYKTGDVLPGMERAYLEHYAPQLELYTLALTRLTDIPVREAGIYILPGGRYVTLGGKDG